MSEVVPIKRIKSKIIQIRNKEVILDRDLAELYGVSTKVFNQAVKRNLDRFSNRFMFQLNDIEKKELVTNCDRFEKLKHSSNNPYAFTEHGALMSANVLNSKRAIEVSVLVIEAFVRMRQLISNNTELAQKIRELEDRLDYHDETLIEIIQALKQLTVPKPKSHEKIGFKK